MEFPPTTTRQASLTVAVCSVLQQHEGKVVAAEIPSQNAEDQPGGDRNSQRTWGHERLQIGALSRRRCSCTALIFEHIFKASSRLRRQQKSICFRRFSTPLRSICSSFKRILLLLVWKRCRVCVTSRPLALISTQTHKLLRFCSRKAEPADRPNSVKANQRCYTRTERAREQPVSQPFRPEAGCS